MIATARQARTTNGRVEPTRAPVTLPIRRVRAAPPAPTADPLAGCGMAMDEKCVFVAYRAVATVLAVLLWPLYRYPDIRSFILAHSRGVGDSALVEARHEHCAVCPHLSVQGDDEFCSGANNGEGCGCGHHRLARSTWKLKLRAWSCPQGHFGAER